MSLNATSFHVRRFLATDTDALAAIYRRAVTDLAGADYSQEQLAAWLSIAPTSEALATLYGDGRQTFIAIDQDARAIAFSDLEDDGHIQFLYVDPAFAGRGVATALLAEIDTAARRSNLGRIHAEASETALPVFLRQGFERVHRRDLSITGVSIHNYAVEKHF